MATRRFELDIISCPDIIRLADDLRSMRQAFRVICYPVPDPQCLSPKPSMALAEIGLDIASATRSVARVRPSSPW